MQSGVNKPETSASQDAPTVVTQVHAEHVDTKLMGRMRQADFVAQNGTSDNWNEQIPLKTEAECKPPEEGMTLAVSKTITQAFGDSKPWSFKGLVQRSAKFKSTGAVSETLWSDKAVARLVMFADEESRWHVVILVTCWHQLTNCHAESGSIGCCRVLGQHDDNCGRNNWMQQFLSFVFSHGSSGLESPLAFIKQCCWARTQRLRNLHLQLVNNSNRLQLWMFLLVGWHHQHDSKQWQSWNKCTSITPLFFSHLGAVIFLSFWSKCCWFRRCDDKQADSSEQLNRHLVCAQVCPILCVLKWQALTTSGACHFDHSGMCWIWLCTPFALSENQLNIVQIDDFCFGRFLCCDFFVCAGHKLVLLIMTNCVEGNKSSRLQPAKGQFFLTMP